MTLLKVRKQILCGQITVYSVLYAIVITQDEYDILVITQV